MNNGARRAAATERQRRRRAQLGDEKREDIRNRGRERNLQTWLNMNDDQRAVYLENMRNRVQHQRNKMDHNKENTFYNGPMNVVCPHCGA